MGMKEAFLVGREGEMERWKLDRRGMFLHTDAQKHVLLL
jgi:hypothetical protein